MVTIKMDILFQAAQYNFMVYYIAVCHHLNYNFIDIIANLSSSRLSSAGWTESSLKFDYYHPSYPGKIEMQLNPLSPGVLDPGTYPGGGPQDPQLYFAFFGLFYAP